MRKQVLISLAIILLLLGSTTLVALYGKGYRFGFSNGKPEISGTGLLVATSQPDGASVYINGHLTTATDNTINLFPGEYSVKITKEGYFSWEKKIKVQKEIVSKAEALLFPSAPKLESVTALGSQHPTLDPSQTYLAYTVASQSARKNGIYVLDMSSRPVLTLQSASTQITDDTANTFSQAHLTWSPDGEQILASVSGQLESSYYLLQANDFNAEPVNVTATLTSVLSVWEKERTEKEEARLLVLKKNLRTLITENFRVLSWSPDDTKILYTASRSAEIPLIIQPRLIGANSTLETRSVEKNIVYVYDMKEDRNYKLNVDNIDPESTANLKPTWLSDSKHLIFVSDGKINIMEYDGLNSTTIYAGPFVNGYAFPWPGNSKIVMLTNLGNSSITPNLYTISLK